MRLAVRSWEPEASGAVAPTLLLVHGTSASARTWWRVAPAFRDAGWRVLAADLRGHGESPTGIYSVDDLGADLDETLIATAPNGAVELAWGHSLGALAVMALLAGRPHAADAAVLEDPPAKRSGPREDFAHRLEAEVALARDDPAASVHQQLKRSPRWSRRDAEENAASLAACDLDSVVGSLRRGLAYRTVDMVAGLRVPALLLLARERDSALGEPDRSTIVRRLPESDVVVFDAGHTIHRDRFEECVATVMGWYARRGQPAERVATEEPATR